MKIVVIHGSPHDGNTLKLAKRFEEIMKKSGDVQFEYLTVRDMFISPCRGCFACITKGEEFCPLKNDDTKLIIEKMDHADGVVFCAPTYVFNTPALMKNLIDRLAYLGHRPRYTGKYAVVISTTCGVGLKESLKYLSFGTALAWGFRLSGTLGACTHQYNCDIRSQQMLNNRIVKCADLFFADLSRKKTEPVSLGEMMRFRIMSLHSFYSKDTFPADYRFYHENPDSAGRYYIKSAQIPLFARIGSGLLAVIAGRSMRKERDRSCGSPQFLDW
ncbi:MAG: flavodoxin family protein [Fibrobacter sp.]|nr:flavodoxin family protein [Fibrobacter sp.]